MLPKLERLEGVVGGGGREEGGREILAEFYARMVRYLKPRSTWRRSGALRDSVKAHACRKEGFDSASQIWKGWRERGEVGREGGWEIQVIGCSRINNHYKLSHALDSHV